MQNQYAGIPMGQGAPLGSPFPDFMNGGPMISGAWLNKKNGKKIIVRDSIIDGDNMIVLTNEGQIPMDIFSRDYIQVSEEFYNETGEVVGKNNVETNEFVNTQIIPDPIVPGHIVPNYEVTEKSQQTVKETTNTHYDLIDKIFNKTKSKPTVKINIFWADFPQTELNMLVNYFDVTIEEIQQYIRNKFVSDEEIVSSLKDTVINSMTNSI